MTPNPVACALAEPQKLEELYRQDPAHFTGQFEQALQIHPHSQILKFWHARLNYSQSLTSSSNQITTKRLLVLVLLCLTATLLAELPRFLPVSEMWYYPRFAPFIVVMALVACFADQGLYASSVKYVVVAGSLLTFVVLLFLPDYNQSSSALMSIIHAPLVLWSILGLTFTAKHWRNSYDRLDYLRYNGELFIYTTLILLGGMVLTGLTIGLFSLIGVDIEGRNQENMVIAGLVSAPIVATFLFDKVMKRNSRFATTIANVFTPLFLILVVVYLFAMVMEQKSPFSDRNFLIVINGLLLLVLAMTVFSICGRNHQHPSRLTDIVNLGLVSVTLIINLIALCAILYRFSEWGISPNRVVVTGANVLIFTHLIQIFKGYVSTLRTRNQGEDLINATVGFLPVYGVWAVIVMVVLPVLFQFE